MDALMRRRQMMISGTGPMPPSPTAIAYIRGGADGSYIDTGITADNTVKVIVWARNWNPGGGILFGSRDGSSVNAFDLGANAGTNTGRIRIEYAQASPVSADDQFTNLSHYHKYELYQGVAKVDDVTVASASNAAFSNSCNIHLFGLNTAGAHSNTALPIDICACQIYKNGTLVRDFTAVYGGLHDSVSGNTFTNAGSGNFSYGMFEPSAYTPLAYIQCTNAQYFDTGIYGKASLQTVVKFRAIGTSIASPRIMGTYTSGTNGTFFLLQLGNSSYKNRYAYFYISSSSSMTIYNNNSTKLTGLDVIFYKDSSSAQLLRNNAVFGTKQTFSVSSSFATPATVMLGTTRVGDSINTADAFNGYLYYAQFGSERNYVPASVNNVAGMYDTYNDTFYPSTSETAFVAGTTL